MSCEAIMQKISELPDVYYPQLSGYVDALWDENRFAKPLARQSARRKAGLLKGKIKMAENFDEPLDDFAEYV